MREARVDVTSSLHRRCDWLLQNVDAETARARRSASTRRIARFKFLEDSRQPATWVAHRLREDHRVSVAAFTETMKPRIWRPFCHGASTSLGSVIRSVFGNVRFQIHCVVPMWSVGSGKLRQKRSLLSGDIGRNFP